jgi:spore coat protein U-like protein
VVHFGHIRQIHKILFLTVFTVSLLSIQSSLVAGTSTNFMSVSAVVNANCLVQNSSINFGVYDPVTANETNAANTTGGLQLRCTRDTPASISMGMGQHASHASNATRAMQGSQAGSYLSYDIYTDNSYSTVWNETNRVQYTASTSAISTINIYAKIPANQQVENGNYTDSIIVSALF